MADKIGDALEADGFVYEEPSLKGEDGWDESLIVNALDRAVKDWHLQHTAPSKSKTTAKKTAASDLDEFQKYELGANHDQKHQAGSKDVPLRTYAKTSGAKASTGQGKAKKTPAKQKVSVAEEAASSSANPGDAYGNHDTQPTGTAETDTAAQWADWYNSGAAAAYSSYAGYPSYSYPSYPSQQPTYGHQYSSHYPYHPHNPPAAHPQCHYSHPCCPPPPHYHPHPCHPSSVPPTGGTIPMPNLPTDDPELASLLSTWYHAGYQTGRYMASRRHP
eukprot:GILK01009146.1.p1 GENE.GILK01009146.1~~GILK01009146.1.p1  ORF type:complete len:300 (-),score=22.44 GILK01009146.1:180-1004(-)